MNKGHGICGMGRFSLRSTAAAMTFMAVGFFTASILDPDNLPTYVRQLFRSKSTLTKSNPITQLFTLCILVLFVTIGVRLYSEINDTSDSGDVISNEETELINKPNGQSSSSTLLLAKKKAIPSMISASLFALGLEISQMTNNTKVLDFLDVTLISKGRWDPSLIFVMGGGVVVSAISYQFISGFNRLVSDDKAISSPLICECDEVQFAKPAKSAIDQTVLLGAVVFGIGWAIGGFCPGPAIYQALVGQPEVMFIFMPFMALGANLAVLYAEANSSSQSKDHYLDYVNQALQSDDIVDGSRQGRRMSRKASYKRSSFVTIEKFDLGDLE